MGPYLRPGAGLIQPPRWAIPRGWEQLMIGLSRRRDSSYRHCSLQNGLQQSYRVQQDAPFIY
jgi:hypothetical protein